MKFNPHPQATRPATAASQPISQRPAAASSTPPASSYRPASTTHSTVSNPTPHSPSSSTSTSAATGATRALSSTVTGPSSRPAGVSDYRGNIDRQSREQKSIGSFLNVIVYGLIGLFVVAALLAGYGAHDVYKQLRQQSTTVSELDARYSAANQELNDKLASTQQGVQQLQGQLSRAQELLLRQQEMLTKLQASLDAETQALREERATRAAETSIREQETATLRSRLRTLEAKIDNTYRP